MGNVQMLFPMEPQEFWQKLKAIVEQVVIEHGNQPPILSGQIDGQLLKVNEVCQIFRVTKPTLYEWMKQGELKSLKIHSRRFFRLQDVQQLIETRLNKEQDKTGKD